MPFHVITVLCIATLLSLGVSEEDCSCNNDLGASNTPWDRDPMLPTDVKPTLYNIALRFNLSARAYDGVTTITISVTSSKESLWFHHRDLDFSSVIIKTPSGQDVAVRDVFKSKRNGFLVITTQKKLPVGEYQLQLTYQTVFITSDVYTEFLYSYQTSNNEQRPVAFTTRFLPCFYQNDFKAVFQLRVALQKQEAYTVIGNAKIQKVQPETPTAGFKTTVFKTSPVLSPKDISVAICGLESLPSMTTSQGIQVTMYGRRKQLKNLRRSLQIAYLALEFYSTYYNYKLDIEKYDIIAAPPGDEIDSLTTDNSFSGSLFVPERIIKYQPGVSDHNEELNQALVMAHAAGYQWNQQLASTTFDSDEFVYEGVTSLLQFKAVDQIFNTWDMKRYSKIPNYYEALAVDADVTQRSLVAYPPSNNMASEEYGNSDTKGSAVIQMLECVMGVESMRRGFADYVKNFARKSALISDLFAALQPHAPAGINITNVLKPWLYLNNFPLITVQRDGNTLKLTQSRFTGNKDDPTDKKSVWEVPLTLKASGGFSITTARWLGADTPVLKIDLPAVGVKWYKLNIQQCNFMIVNYTQDNWDALAALLDTKMTELDPTDRGELVDAAFKLAQAEYIKIETALSMTRYISKEKHFLGIFAFDLHIFEIGARLNGRPGYDVFKKYIRKLLEPNVGPSTWILEASAPPTERLKQVMMLYRACVAEVKSCVDIAKIRFDQYLRGRKPKPGNPLTPIFFSIGMWKGTICQWNSFWVKYLFVKEDDPDKWIYLSALCEVPDASFIKGLLDTTIIIYDLQNFLVYCSDNPIGLPVVFDYVKENWKKISEAIDLSNVISSVAQHLNTAEELKEMEELFKKIPEEILSNKSRQSVTDIIKKNILWLQKYEDRVTKWFQKEVSHKK